MLSRREPSGSAGMPAGGPAGRAAARARGRRGRWGADDRGGGLADDPAAGRGGGGVEDGEHAALELELAGALGEPLAGARVAGVAGEHGLAGHGGGVVAARGEVLVGLVHQALGLGLALAALGVLELGADVAQACADAAVVGLLERDLRVELLRLAVLARLVERLGLGVEPGESRGLLLGRLGGGLGRGRLAGRGRGWGLLASGEGGEARSEDEQGGQEASRAHARRSFRRGRGEVYISPCTTAACR